jgi:hypothetical protein
MVWAFGSAPSADAQDPDEVYPGPTPRADCGPGSNPEEGRQGRVSAEDFDSGRAAEGYTCNAEQLSHHGARGGYKVERFIDQAGHECAFYDSTLLFPKDAVEADQDLTGVYVLDMANPSQPVRTETLVTPAMQSPHESMNFNAKRGLLIAVTANPIFYPGFVDVYDVNQDCRHPTLMASLPVGGLGHESGFAPDGMTFYSASLDAGGGTPVGTLTAVDVSNPSLPVPIWNTLDFRSHGLSLSDDGNRAYIADRTGLVILDVSEIQARELNPQHRVVSTLTWPTRSTPQITIPVTINNHPFLVEMDEFGSGETIGAARIIDIADETKPFVVSNIKLEVNMPQVQASQVNDPGVGDPFQSYTGHYCSVSSRKDPGVLACTFILSGLRLFDIRDPYEPKEIAYFNPPGKSTSPLADDPSNFAMSSPVLIPERSEVWYTDGNSGFYAVRITNSAADIVANAGTSPRTGGGLAPSGGDDPPIGIALALLVVGLALALAMRSARSKSKAA